MNISEIKTVAGIPQTIKSIPVEYIKLSHRGVFDWLSMVPGLTKKFRRAGPMSKEKQKGENQRRLQRPVGHDVHLASRIFFPRLQQTQQQLPHGVALPFTPCSCKKRQRKERPDA